MILEIYLKYFDKLPESLDNDIIKYGEAIHDYYSEVEKNVFVVHKKDQGRDTIVFTIKDPKLLGKDKYASCIDIMHIVGYSREIYTKPYDIRQIGERIIFKIDEK
jgi:hypothetical protein